MSETETAGADAIESAGFTHAWIKPDPRGDEYGTYMAQLTEMGITVTFVPPPADPVPGFRFHFDRYIDFINWAQTAL